MPPSGRHQLGAEAAPNGNNNYAGSAKIRDDELGGKIARRSFIYRPYTQHLSWWTRKDSNLQPID